MITRDDKIKFRISLEDEPEIFEETLVKEIIFYGFEESKVFQFVKINQNKAPVLLEVLSYGEVTLYENKVYSYTNHYMSSLYESGILYLKRKNESIATKVGFNFKKQAKEYFKDCSIIQELINSKEYKLLTEKELVEEYNVFCTD